ncbi:unnamed protein product [Somion occarium]|uniref:Uncharacterized protein n=1 Tax=Somion occarium TaxID=3059160 RepID=A0ABP1EAS8_9APHY
MRMSTHQSLNKPTDVQSNTMQQGTQTRPREARNALERALLKLPPGVVPDRMFPTDEEIDEEFRPDGYPEEELPALRQWYHDRCNHLFKEQTETPSMLSGSNP